MDYLTAREQGAAWGGGSVLHQELFCAWKMEKGEWKFVCGGVGRPAGRPHTSATSHLGFILTQLEHKSRPLSFTHA